MKFSGSVVLTLFCFDRIYAHKFSLIKDIVRQVSITPGNIYYEVTRPDVCFCNTLATDYESLGMRNDSDDYASDFIYLYSYVSGRDCSVTRPFVAYRVDILANKVQHVICDHLGGHIMPEECKTGGTPKPPDSTVCPAPCRDLIRSIPRGEKGERGERGPMGPEGKPGKSGDSPGKFYGVAPPRTLALDVPRRTYSDVARALSDYTGCTLDQGYHYLWFTDVRYPTYCKTTWAQGKYLKDVLARDVKTGYVVLWYWGGEQLTLRFAAYRTAENDVVPVICDPSFGPIFFPRMGSRPEDKKCPLKEPSSPEVPDFSSGGSNVISYVLLSSIVTVFIGSFFAYRYFNTVEQSNYETVDG